jgi:hypothetical protein
VYPLSKAEWVQWGQMLYAIEITSVIMYPPGKVPSIEFLRNLARVTIRCLMATPGTKMRRRLG